MTELLRTTVNAVGPDVADLLEGGVLVLFAAGAPPELAEISVLHEVAAPAAAEPPTAGAALCIGPLAATLTGIGSQAWAKVRDIGHVVVNFNAATAPERPGELCATRLDPQALRAALQPGAVITITG